MNNIVKTTAKNIKNTMRLIKDKHAFYQALKALDASAIRYLADSLNVSIKKLHNIYFLSPEDIEELRNDAILITLKKLQDGSFQFQEYDPLAYTMGVARKLLSNCLKKKKPATVSLDHQDCSTSDFDPERFVLRKETETAIGKLLAILGKNCEQVIRLKYYDNLRDQEVVEQKLTPYSTIDSLKNKRSQCLKKLAEKIKNQGFSIAAQLK